MQVIDKLLDLLLQMYSGPDKLQMPLGDFQGAIAFEIGAHKETIKTYTALAKQFRLIDSVGNGVISFNWEQIAVAVERRVMKLRNEQQVARFTAFLKEVQGK